MTNRTAAISAAGLAVVVLGSGGAWYLTSSGSNPGGTGQRTGPAQSAPSTTDGLSGSPAVPMGSDTPVPSGTPSSTPSGAVTTDPAVSGNPMAPGVVAFLSNYFDAINNHDYNAYNALLGSGMTALSSSDFDNGYGTTTDSGETLTGIAKRPGGEVVASVSFTSNQDPSQSPDQSACDKWKVRLYLMPNSGGYLEVKPPSGYKAQYTSC